MYPRALACHCAISAGGRIEFPATAGWKSPTLERCARVTMRGGHSFDVPEPVLANKPFHPCPSAFPRPNASKVPYTYSANNNAGVAQHFNGTLVVTAAQAELLGWLLGSDSLTAERQSVRFISSEPAALHRVQRLAKLAFPTVKAKWYAKAGGYDITLTGGISSPLKHFIRAIDFYEGCPMAVGRHFSSADVIHFLKGVWGSQGWIYSRKGGNDICFGLSRTSNEYLYSWLRLLHASIGLQGSRETAKNGSFRTVFSGFRNYAVFMREIGQFSASKLPALPIRRHTPAPPTYLANGGETWYDAPVQKVECLSHVAVTYRV